MIAFLLVKETVFWFLHDLKMRQARMMCDEPNDTVAAHKKKSEEEQDKADKDTQKALELVLTPPVVVAGRSRSQVALRRVTPTTLVLNLALTVSTLEKPLPNGDLYIGSFSGKVPHGSGKYLWTDGCMYEGDWRRGKACGKGKFSWPSGATYEGEFKSGRMEGFGTFNGSAGDSYRGSWSADRKHGFGRKEYANGDFYEGSWKKNLQDGQGRYVWKNGNEYVGEWKDGVISGKGVLIWTNGNRYEGQWKNGVPKGNGIFSWPDGGCYIGSWTKDAKMQRLIGAYYPGSGKEQFLKSTGPFMGFDNYTLMLGKRSSFDSDRGIMTEKTFPRICIWDSDGEDGDITCDIVDNMEASLFYRDGNRLDRGDHKHFRRNTCLSGEVKKPGQTISIGHKNYDLMLNLQLGIRYSVGRHATSMLRKLQPSDFDPKEKFWTRFPSEGSKKTPPHQSAEFRWKDYCPMVFRHLRELFQVDPADYMLAICGNDSLRELSSPGKSGSCFYLTQDDRFMIKTVKKSEVKVLIGMLRSYYDHMSCYENSLITKFYGVHCVKPIGGPKTRFIVMGNLLRSDYQIHRRFDLKGSSHGRTTNKPEGEIDETTTLKDLDLNYVFRLQNNWLQDLITQIERDCKFLEAERIMDYSLLVGLHFRGDNTYDKMGLSPFILRTGKKDSYKNEKFIRGCRFLEAELQDMDRVLAGRKPLIRLGANMPARAERIARRSDFDQYPIGGGISHFIPSRNGEVYEVVLYFGIIDILQDYDITKKLEHAYKSTFQADPSSISAVDPMLYSTRFRDLVGRIFIEDR